MNASVEYDNWLIVKISFVDVKEYTRHLLCERVGSDVLFSNQLKLFGLLTRCYLRGCSFV